MSELLKRIKTIAHPAAEDFNDNLRIAIVEAHNVMVLEGSQGGGEGRRVEPCSGLKIV